MTTKRPKHGSAGERLVAEVLSALARDELEPDVREAERLHLAADMTDRLAAIREQLAREGLTTPAGSGRAAKTPSRSPMTVAAAPATSAATPRIGPNGSSAGITLSEKNVAALSTTGTR
jgi:hypothetical protein